MNRPETIQIGQLIAKKLGSVDPSKFPCELFDYYSIPAFDTGRSSLVAGSEIGSAKQIIQSGDVLLSRIVPHIRRAWVVEPNGGHRIIGSGEWIVFRSDRFYPPFLRQLLINDSFHQEFMRTVSGVGGSLLRARPSNVALINIDLPSIKEQRRIAAILDQAEALRAKRRQGLAKLDTLTQSLLEETWIANKNKTMVKLGAICSRITDGVHQKPDYAESGVPFISVKNISGGMIDFRNTKFISSEDHASYTRRVRPERGDILYTKVGSYGRAALIEADEEFSIYVSVSLLKPERQLVNSTYLAAVMNAPFVKRQADARIKGIGVPDLHLDQIEQFSIPMISREQQDSFQEQFRNIVSMREALNSNSMKLDKLASSLQHRAFRGEL